MKRMKEEEVIVERYLSSLALGPVLYEPDGNIPPDFLVCPDIAVEVRRLNENYTSASHSEGLETATINLWRLMTALLATYKKRPGEKTYWISIRYERPIPPMKSVRQKVRRILDEFLRTPSDSPQTCEITPELKVEIRYLGPVVGLDEQRYAMASGRDANRGGFVIPNFLRNLNLCILEKSGKIRPHLTKYPKWWLVLVDSLTLGLTEDELKELPRLLPSKGIWEKIVLIDPKSAKSVLSF